MPNFHPPETGRDCAGCEHFAGDIPGTFHAYCVRGDTLQVQTFRERGCVFWIRAVGADDDAPAEKHATPMTLESGKMKEIPLTRGLVALVDDEDYEDLSKHRWYADTRGYAFRPFVRVDASSGKTKKSMLLMHRYLLGLDFGDPLTGDHADTNKLNNQRDNLRACTQTRNAQNLGRRATNTSGFKGVFWDNRLRTWTAMIQSSGIRKYLGSFDTPEEAHQHYCKAARELHGDFANTGIVSSDLALNSGLRPRAKRSNKTGFTGVFQDGNRESWSASIKRKGKRTHLGCFKSPEEAHAAYCAAELKCRESNIDEEMEVNC